MRSYRLSVVGEPAPQGSKRAFIVNGRAVLVESSSEKVKAWRKVVAQVAKIHADACPIDGSVAVNVVFRLRPPKALRGFPAHTKRPDVDKLLRSTFDAISGVLWNDDSQVTSVHAVKRYALPDEEPGATIEVREL